MYDFLTNIPMGFRIKRKETTMSETRGLVKSALGFLLAILVMVGSAFGLDIQVDMTDTQNQTSDVGRPPTEENVEITYEVVETNQSPADSTPTEDEEPSVDESVETEVTEPTDEQQDTVTEKGEN